jgi:DNA-binding NarL/FixJ family response regulator
MYRSKELGGNRVTVGTAAERQSRPEEPLRPGSRKVVRILLVDDHEVVRHGLAAFLQNEPDLRVVGQAASGAEAVEIAGRLNPDVVVMDVTMPGMDGIEATRVIKERQPGARVIGLSALADVAVTRRMADAGASLFLSKAASPHELLRAIRSVRG